MQKMTCFLNKKDLKKRGQYIKYFAKVKWAPSSYKKYVKYLITSFTFFEHNIFPFFYKIV